VLVGTTPTEFRSDIAAEIALEKIVEGLKVEAYSVLGGFPSDPFAPVRVSGPRTAILKRTAARGRRPMRASPSRRIVGMRRLQGARQLFDRLVAKKFSEWIMEEKRVFITDTTMRDAQQSLLATRMRTCDVAAMAPA
jgi:hypothetical protein